MMTSVITSWRVTAHLVRAVRDLDSRWMNRGSQRPSHSNGREALPPIPTTQGESPSSLMGQDRLIRAQCQTVTIVAVALSILKLRNAQSVYLGAGASITGFIGASSSTSPDQISSNYAHSQRSQALRSTTSSYSSKEANLRHAIDAFSIHVLHRHLSFHPRLHLASTQPHRTARHPARLSSRYRFALRLCRRLLVTCLPRSPYPASGHGGRIARRPLRFLGPRHLPVSIRASARAHH